MNHSIFRDLVPSYIENLTSEETNRQMEKHMEQCENCQKYLNEMQEDLLLESVQELKKEERDIDFLKKVRSKNRKKVFTIVTSLISIPLILIVGYYFIFVNMWIAEVNNVQATIQKQGTAATLSFKAKNDNHYLLGMTISSNEDYIDHIIIYEKRNDFSSAAKILKDGMSYSYTFLDENTLLLNDGKEKKLTDKDKIYIQYKDSTEEIVVKDLYVPENQ